MAKDKRWENALKLEVVDKAYVHHNVANMPRIYVKIYGFSSFARIAVCSNAGVLTKY